MGNQIAGHQRKKIRRLWPRVVPFRPTRARTGRVPIGQKCALVAFDADREGGHHVGAVGVIGDFAEPFGLTLRAIHAAGHVKPLQRRIGGRIDRHLGFPDERPIRHIGAQLAAVNSRCDRLAVNRCAEQIQVQTIEVKVAICCFGVGPKRNSGLHNCAIGIQSKCQLHIVYDEAVGLIVGKINRVRGGVFGHENLGQL